MCMCACKQVKVKSKKIKQTEMRIYTLLASLFFVTTDMCPAIKIYCIILNIQKITVASRWCKIWLASVFSFKFLVISVLLNLNLEKIFFLFHQDIVIFTHNPLYIHRICICMYMTLDIIDIYKNIISI